MQRYVKNKCGKLFNVKLSLVFFLIPAIKMFVFKYAYIHICMYVYIHPHCPFHINSTQIYSLNFEKGITTSSKINPTHQYFWTWRVLVKRHKRSHSITAAIQNQQPGHFFVFNFSKSCSVWWYSSTVEHKHMQLWQVVSLCLVESTILLVSELHSQSHFEISVSIQQGTNWTN